MPFFETVKIDSAEQLFKWASNHDPLAHWAFRGHYSEACGLTTTLERACEQNSIPPDQRPAAERKLVREFARKAYLYLPAQEIPDPDDTLEWFSLMQHFGAPTRLLDWTVSFEVALHFAFSRPAVDVRFVWAVDTQWLNDGAETLSPGLNKNANGDKDKRGGHFRQHFLGNKKRFVSIENPYRINKRLAIQQGTFLCPGDVSSSFVQNLKALGNSTGRAYCLRIQGGCWSSIEDVLFRVNINSEVLFPGIDGLAGALWTRASPHYSRMSLSQRHRPL
jgi:FRG domain